MKRWNKLKTRLSSACFDGWTDHLSSAKCGQKAHHKMCQKLKRGGRASKGASTSLRRSSWGKCMSRGRRLMETEPGPGQIQTRATLVLRRPVAYARPRWSTLRTRLAAYSCCSASSIFRRSSRCSSLESCTSTIGPSPYRAAHCAYSNNWVGYPTATASYLSSSILLQPHVLQGQAGDRVEGCLCQYVRR